MSREDLPGRIARSLEILTEQKGLEKPISIEPGVDREGNPVVIRDMGVNGAVFPASGEQGLAWAERLEAAVERGRSQT